MWSTLAVPELRSPTATFMGSVMYLLRMASTSFGMVAEKSMVWRPSLGMYSRMSSTSSWKPMLSISSASSRIIVFTLLKSTRLRRIISRRRPGVATIICGFLAKSLN